MGEQMQKKYKSRKLWVTLVEMGSIVGVPVLFKMMDIANEITLVVVGCLAVSAGVYKGANILEKKYGVRDE
jgi:hypothetical protein